MITISSSERTKVVVECLGDYWYLYDESGSSVIGTEEGFNTEEEATVYAKDNNLTIVTSFNLG